MVNSKPFMIIDVGSYTISFTIYESLSRYLKPLTSRHIRASLGEGVLKTGKIKPENIAKARHAFQQAFVNAQLRKIPNQNVFCLATAALRMAKNGSEIIAQLESEFNTKITLLSGEEEAYYAALGILSEYPKADGIIGDLGGSSLELSWVEKGKVEKMHSLGFGHLTFQEISANRKEIKNFINQGLLTVPWVNRDRTPSLYLTGGAWRTIGRLHMSLDQYPIENVHHYKMKSFDALNFFDSLASLLPGEANGLREVDPDRQERMSVVALLALQLMRACQPQKVYFCANGLRHGYAYSLLNDVQKQEDQLEVGIRELGPQSKRGEKVLKWMSSIIKYQDDVVQKLVSAAVFMCDATVSDHPKYQALHALEHSARWPFMGISHGERAFLGLILYVRFGGKLDNPGCSKFVELLSPEFRELAEYFGHALRLACLMSDHDEKYLTKTSITPSEEGLVFKRNEEELIFQDDDVQDLFNRMNAYYLATKTKAA